MLILRRQFYAQPYLTAGDYTNLREVRDPKNPVFDERFVKYTDEQLYTNAVIDYDENDDPIIAAYALDYDLDGQYDHSFRSPNFNYKQINTNLVMRWEIKPGSTVYFVWSTGKSDYLNVGEFNLTKDAKALWNSQGDNVLLVKFNYLLRI